MLNESSALPIVLGWEGPQLNFGALGGVLDGLVRMDISEHDWKLLRKLHEVALQRFCDRVLSEYRGVLDDVTQSPHARFLHIFELTRTRNRELADAFDDLRRSRALHHLFAMRRLGVITDDDLAHFSAETRSTVAGFGESV